MNGQGQGQGQINQYWLDNFMQQMGITPGQAGGFDVGAAMQDPSQMGTFLNQVLDIDNPLDPSLLPSFDPNLFKGMSRSTYSPQWGASYGSGLDTLMGNLTGKTAQTAAGGFGGTSGYRKFTGAQMNPFAQQLGAESQRISSSIAGSKSSYQDIIAALKQAIQTSEYGQ